MGVHLEMVQARRVKAMADAQRMAEDRLTATERMMYAVAAADDPEAEYNQIKMEEYQRAMFVELDKMK